MDIATVVDEYIEPEDLEKFRRIYQEQARRGAPSATATFSFAHALIKSVKEDVKHGIALLESLLRGDSEDIPKRDYVYYLAVAHTRIKEYDRALGYIDLLLSAESDNRQATDLKELIQKRMKRDGLMGLAFLGLGGGAALIVGAVAAGVLARRH